MAHVQQVGLLYDSGEGLRGGVDMERERERERERDREREKGKGRDGQRRALSMDRPHSQHNNQPAYMHSHPLANHQRRSPSSPSSSPYAMQALSLGHGHHPLLLNLAMHQDTLHSPTASPASAHPPILIPPPPPPSAALLRAIPLSSAGIAVTRQMSMPAVISRTRSRSSFDSDTASTISRSSFSYSDNAYSTTGSIASAPSKLSSPSLGVALWTRSRALSSSATRSHREFGSDGLMAGSSASSVYGNPSSQTQHTSISAITTAGFMEPTDPKWTLRHILAQPNVMYGLVRREKPSQTWLKSLKSKSSPYILALVDGNLAAFQSHKNGVSLPLRSKLTTHSGEGSSSLSLNGPFFTTATTTATTTTTDNNLVPSKISTSLSAKTCTSLSAAAATSSSNSTLPVFSTSVLYNPPSSVLQLTCDSEIHVSEKGVFVLRVTGKKIRVSSHANNGTSEVLAGGGVWHGGAAAAIRPGKQQSSVDVVANAVAAAGLGASVVDFQSPAATAAASSSPRNVVSHLQEDKTWMLQFDDADAMMEWMTRIRRVISAIKGEE
ncbi:hypothetical protein HDU80_001522 [Chytriomyces hyalinus]|nr:hypothetical protein HDU80_001522 [Chytriomyces hyalinus]